MRAMLLTATGSLDANPAPLKLVEIDDPSPVGDEILIRVAACGVCHTELDEIEGRTLPRLPVVPGHEVVGRVVASGPGASRFRHGERVGVGWIHSSDGTEEENISPAFRATGRDVNGGYAELMTVSETYAAPIPGAFTDVEAAPLMCAGGVGYRALRLTGIENGICTRTARFSYSRAASVNDDSRSSSAPTGAATRRSRHRSPRRPSSTPRPSGSP